MSIKCPDCGHWNDNDRLFCEECGEPIDPQTRLIMELEGKKAPTKHSDANTTAKNDDDDDDYIAPSYHEEEKKKFPAGLALILVAVAAMAYFFFLR